MPNLFQNLSKWQAVNHPELANRKPEELFNDDFAKRYTRLHGLLWRRIIHLNGTLVTLEALQEFPFRQIYAPNDMSFWVLVSQNFRDMSYVILHALVNDCGPDAHTLPRFKNEINSESWKDQSMLALFRKSLAESRFDSEVTSVAKRIDRIRDHRVAHQLVDYSMASLKGVMDGVSLEEFRELFDATHKLFGALCFGSGYMTLTDDLIPSTTGGKPNRTCLDSVLDAVLKDNHFVNLPENRGVWWRGERERMDPADLALMNELRTRVGKSPA